ncbi:hypothetical protein PR048_031411 [Dryococelus australis]|uniref:Neither inactivation nor afterpotential protein C n=1 Tax=Dryococelus australis TaxID=614101 RepID=A0ABQ9G565_9NEOP|nr:hypothetical protein PR048_031411 [Dryococelus australis]
MKVCEPGRFLVNDAYVNVLLQAGKCVEDRRVDQSVIIEHISVEKRVDQRVTIEHISVKRRNGVVVPLMSTYQFSDWLPEIRERALCLIGYCVLRNILYCLGLLADNDATLLGVCSWSSVNKRRLLRRCNRLYSQALVNFNESHVMHRDVKANNVLLTKEGEVKLVGFQLSRKLRGTLDRRHTCIGSPCWMAPEVVTSNQREGDTAGYDSRADVWALGITAIELGDGKAPFQDMHPTRALFQIVRNPPPTLYRPANWSQIFNDFITECLEKNPEHRPFVVELTEHPFLTSVPENDYHVSCISQITPQEIICKSTISVLSRALQLAQELKALLQDMGGVKERAKEGARPESFVRRNLLKVGPASPLEEMYVEDLAALEDIREEAILAELQERLKHGHFHTFVGDVLLVLNPNEQQDIYGDHFHVKYQCRSRSDNEPHIYAVADRAYQDAMHHEEPQHILLAGESLSGKTANFRHLLRHLCFLGKGGSNVGDRVENAVEVVQALGNAATPINPNSTRYLLQLEVTYTSTGKISGAIVWLFQLEKWRVSCSDRHQANFHVFYYWYDAMEAEGRLGQYKLERGRRYNYLRTAKEEGGVECTCGPREESKENVWRFKQLRQHLASLDFEEEQVETMWCLIAAVITLGEIQFRDSGDKVAEVSNPEVASNAAWLLGVEEKKFIWALTNYCVVEKGTAARRRHSASQAAEARDALANGIYFRLVDWVVNVINLKLSFTRAVFGDKYSIGLMDLFGFECFKKNSLEQLFVNTINEQLQYHYSQRMFVWEMQEQEEEEIPLQTLQFYDNKPTVDELMSKPSGLLYLLDEASRSSRGPELIIETLKGEGDQNKRLRAIGRHDFSVAHYTGKVTYSAQHMADKNRDFLPPEMIETLRLSSDHVVQKLFTNQLSRTGNLTLTSEERGAIASKNKGRWGAALVAGNQAKPRKFNTESHGEYSQTRKMRTAAATFRGCCLELLRGLAVGAGSGGTHFVRCLRADLLGQPRAFQVDVVRQQVRALAVLETARARQKGYPHRVPFPEFIRRYKFLAFDFDENVDVTKDNCRLLLVRLKMEGWVIGKSKVFLKYYNEEYLSRTYESQVKKIIKVQTMMRAFLAKKSVASKLLKFRQNTGKTDSLSDASTDIVA